MLYCAVVKQVIWQYYLCVYTLKTLEYYGKLLKVDISKKWDWRRKQYFNLLFLYTSMSLTTTTKSPQSCLTLCDPRDGSPPGSPGPGILQARTLEWVAISLSNAWKWKVKVKSLSRVRLLATPWTAAYQAPPSMGFSRQEYWSGVPLHLDARAIFKKVNWLCSLLKLEFY